MEAPAPHSLAADLPKQAPKPGSDLKEADLITLERARLPAACTGWLHSLHNARDNPLKRCSRRKHQEVMLLEVKGRGNNRRNV